MHNIVTNHLFSSCCRTWIAHVLHANERKQKTKQGRREDYPAVLAVVVVICSGWRRWWSFWGRQEAALVTVPAVRGGQRWLCFSFSLSPLFFCSHLCFFFFCSLSSLLCPLSSLLYCLSLGPSLVFIGKQGRETWLGQPLCCHPSIVPSTRGKWVMSVFFWSHRGEGSQCETEEKRKSSSPLFSACPGEENNGVIQNDTISGVVFFFLTVHETALFWSKRAVSFKRKRRQNASDSKKAFNLSTFCILVLGLGFLQLNP